MTDPVSLASATPRFGLDLLFPGQAQKEFSVNAAHALTDALLHLAIEGEAATPPANPADGQCWLVSAEAAGAFAGQPGRIACRQSGTWLFVEPRDGVRAYDRATGQQVLYADGWKRAASPAPPAGGGTVDAEARAAIQSVVFALQEMGIFPTP